jgi:hypothetical protein
MKDWSGSLVAAPWHILRLQVVETFSIYELKVSANILSKKLLTASKELPSSVGRWMGV